MNTSGESGMENPAATISAFQTVQRSLADEFRRAQATLQEMRDFLARHRGGSQGTTPDATGEISHR
jgi:hypothetical protein